MRNAAQSAAPAAAAVAGAIASWGFVRSAPGCTGSPLMITSPPPDLTSAWAALGTIGPAVSADGASDRGTADAASATTAVGDALRLRSAAGGAEAARPGPVANHSAPTALVTNPAP